MTMQTIIAGGGDQDVWIYAHDRAGLPVVPSSATAQIVDLTIADGASGRVIVATDTATIDPASTTTTAAVGQGAADTRLVPVTSAAGITLGRRYLLSAGGRSEAFTVERIDGISIYSRDPIRYRYTSGATVEGLRVSFTFPGTVSVDGEDRGADVAAELADDVQFGIDWTFSGIDGPSPVRTLARIQRRAKQLRASVDDLLRIDPQLAATTQARSKLESHLAQADLEVTALLEHRNVDDATTIDGVIGKLAVAWRAVEFAYRVLDSNQSHVDRAEWAAGQAETWSRRLTNGHKSPDRIETSREEDRRRRPRRPADLGTIRSST